MYPDEFIEILHPFAMVTGFPMLELKTDLKLPVVLERCAVAPESIYHWLSDGSMSVNVLNAEAKSIVGFCFWFAALPNAP